MYQPPDMNLWQGRSDPEPEERGRRWHQCVTPLPSGKTAPGAVLLGVCSDEGVRRNLGRPGARDGPDAIRRAMANQAWHLPRPLYDGGNLTCDGGDLEALAVEQAQRVARLLEQGHFPLLLGGGHEMAYGSGLGLIRHLESAGEAGTLGILNFDAHFDLRQAPRPSSGTPFLQLAEHCRSVGRPFRYGCLGVSETANTAALFDRAAALGAVYRTDEELTPWNLPQIEADLTAFLQGCDALHLSIDLDVLPAATAPGVSAPAARGVPLEILEHLLGVVRARAWAKLKLAEIAEYNPALDSDGRTARVAARLAHLLLR